MTEHGIDKLWYGQAWPWAAWLLAPLAWLFGLLCAMRRAAYRRGWLHSRHPGVPVIVVGNLTVGGSGKTPMVIWLSHELMRRGRRVGIVSRGYGGSLRAVARLPANAAAAIYGDEPVMVQAATGCPVAVGADRASAAELLVREAAVEVVVSDDGLQHYGLRRDVEIVVVDGLRGFGNGLLLPAGPNREPSSRLASVDAIVYRDGDYRPRATRAPGAAIEVDMQVAAGPVRPLIASAAELTELAQWRGRKVHAIAGIGLPERFFAPLRAAGMEVIEHAARDHHRWIAQELDFGDRLPVLMTAKDAVKCRGFAQPHWYCVEARAQIPAEQAERLLSGILARISAPGK